MAVNYVVVLPYVIESYYRDCIASMSDRVRTNVLAIDNTVTNIGVTKAWNLGLDKMYDSAADWLVLLSAAIRFQNGGDDFVAQLDEAHLDVVEACDVFGWHLIGFHRRIFDKVGKFDENLPIYFSDIDFSLRVRKAFQRDDLRWSKVHVAVADMGMAHGVKLAGIHDPAQPRIEYFQRKWGRHPGAWDQPSYEHPFNGQPCWS